MAALGIAFGAPARCTALAAAIANLAIVIGMWIGFKGGSDFHYIASRVVLDSPRIAYAVGLDGLSLILVLLSALITFCAIWIKVPDTVSTKVWFISCLLISAGAMGAFVTTDVFFIYAFHELALIPTFLMIGLYGHGGRENRLHAAWKITIYLGLGSLILLAGLVWLVLKASPAGALTFDLS
jgi:NADH-quinone oxidoreductase subunit M